jgi:hypothetical protein
MTLDDELRQALRPKAPPDGFADRVLARVALSTAGGPGSRSPHRRARLIRALAVAAALVVTAAGTSYYRYEMVQLEGERAAREARVALEIASQKLALVERRVNRADDTKASTREVP